MRNILLSIAAGALMVLMVGCAHDRRPPISEPVPYSTVIDAKVHRLLAADPQLKGYDIKVNTFQGQVELDGVVDTEAQRQQASKLTWGVAGVRSVENNLLLKSEKTRETRRPGPR